MSRRPPATADEDELECCDGTGHASSCESREPAWDIGDLIARCPCDGCCPAGHRSKGLQREQDVAASKARTLFRQPQPKYRRVHFDIRDVNGVSDGKDWDGADLAGVNPIDWEGDPGEP